MNERLNQIIEEISAGNIPHDYYLAGDVDCPESILDRNGEVALSSCRACGQGEGDLEEFCPSKTMTEEVTVKANAFAKGQLAFPEKPILGWDGNIKFLVTVTHDFMSLKIVVPGSHAKVLFISHAKNYESSQSDWFEESCVTVEDIIKAYGG